MAGEWLKFEKATPDKPEVFAIAAALNMDPDAVVGKLIRVWSWFDTHTVSGNGAGVTSPLLDRISGVTGFVAAMQAVGWIEVTPEGVSLPNFDRHTGETAKGRALTAKRVANHKNKSNAKGNDPIVTTALPREEKRREEKKEQKTAPSGDLLAGIEPQIAADFRKLRDRLRAPITQTALDGIKREANKAGVTLDAALAMCCERGWRGFKSDWVTGSGNGRQPNEPAALPRLQA